VASGVLQALLKGVESLAGIRFTGKREPTKLIEGFEFLLTLFAPAFHHGLLGLKAPGVRGNEQPTLVGAAVGGA
jgi:hypothetical protein